MLLNLMNAFFRQIKYVSYVLALAVILSGPVVNVYADHGENFFYISQGFSRILGSTFQIPGYMIHKTLSGPVGIGTVDGILSGTYGALHELSQGTFQMAQGAAPYAKYLVFMA